MTIVAPPQFDRRHGSGVDHYAFRDFIALGSKVAYTRSLCGVHLGELPICHPERFRRGRIATELEDGAVDVMRLCSKCEKIRARFLATH